MKRLIIGILIAALLVMGCSPAPTATSWNTYTNYTYGYSLEYPASWEVDDSDQSDVWMWGRLGVDIMIYVEEIDIPPGLTLERYVDLWVDLLREESFEFHLLSKARMYTYDGWEIVYTNRFEPTEELFRPKECYVLRGGYLYEVVYAGPLAEYDLYSSELGHAYNSFRFH